MDSIKKKVLVVEDERPIAKALELKLIHSGFDVQVASDGEEAINAADKSNFDLIILDLIMPKMDGFEVLTRLKSKNHPAKIIVTSNLSQKEDVQRVKDLGATEYFVKSNTSLFTLVKYITKLLTT